MTENIRTKIRETIFESLPEEIKARKLINDLVKYIYDYSFNILTDAEKEFFETYPEECKLQSCLCFRGNGFDFKEEFTEISQYYYSDEIVKILVLKNITDVRIVNDEDKNCPWLGRWDDISRDFPDLYNHCKNTIKEILILKMKILNKINKLDEVIKMKSITLTKLKSYYPELYKIAKS